MVFYQQIWDEQKGGQAAAAAGEESSKREWTRGNSVAELVDQ